MERYTRLAEKRGMVWLNFKRACPACSAHIPKYKRVCPGCGQYVKNFQGRVVAG